MDLSIKTEPDILEEFLKQKLVEKINSTVPCMENIEQKVSKKSQQRISGKQKYFNKLNKKKIVKGIGRNKKEGGFTNYLKVRFLQNFMQEGCSPQIVAKYANIYGVQIEEINKHFDEAAKEAQQFVYQECDSLSFSNITEWLQHLQAEDVSNHCNYDPAIVMNAIANNEYHPGPEAMNGIDLKAIYKFLSNSLMGLPQAPLDETSAKFLSQEFKNLINEANTDEADKDVRNMKEKIEHSLRYNPNKKFCNLDPLNTDTEELEKSYAMVKNANYLNLELIPAKSET